MSLLLSVMSYQGQPPSQARSINLREQRATIGRQEDNTLVLPDPEKYISGQHAIIEYRAPDYYITDTSSNGVFINKAERPLGRNNTARLADGDRIFIGEYEISVEITAPEAEKEPICEESAFPKDPFADLGKNLIDKIVADSTSIPEDWNASKDFGFPSDTAPEQKKRFRGSEPDHISALEEAFQSLPGKRKTSVEKKEVTAETAEKAKKNNIPENWFDLGDAAEVTTQEESVQASEPEPITEQAPRQAEERPTQAVSQPAEQGALEQDIIRQFLEGAGLQDSDIADSLGPDTFYQVGKILRTSIQGTMDVLIARSKIKNEMRLDVTTIRSTRNNPIKFSFNVDEALGRLLAPPEKGYMEPVLATEEAFDDLKAHQIAVLAGMQTALQSVLKRFNPKTLEHRLQKRSPIGASIPIHKQAKLWDLFEQLYEEIQHEVEDDFNLLFGQAYEEQIRNLKEGKHEVPVDHADRE